MATGQMSGSNCMSWWRFSLEHIVDHQFDLSHLRIGTLSDLKHCAAVPPGTRRIRVGRNLHYSARGQATPLMIRFPFLLLFQTVDFG